MPAVRDILVLPAALLGMAFAASAFGQGGNPNLARNLAATCANCHGTDGVSLGGFASLAGKPKDDLARTMREFKAGTRPATVMTQLAKGYSDEQIDLIAGWFAVQKPAAK